MTAQETNLFNAFETTLATTMGSSNTTLTVAAVTDSYPTTLSAPFYIVINPDSATNREVILVTAVNTGTKELTTSVPNRYLPGSAASSGLSHSSGQVVRMTPLQQHMEDINDRVDTVINEDGTAVNTSLFLDEDDMVSDSATKGVTQQSVKAYVDSQVTAQDLDFLGDSGSGAVDLDSQDFTIAGTANEIETSASGQTLTIGLPSSITVNVTGDLTGNVSGDLTGNVTATSVLADGVTATTQSAGDNSTKVATTAYVDAVSVDDDLTVGNGTSTTTIDLDTQTLSILGTTDEIDVGVSAQTLTLSLPATINANTTGSAATLTTGRTIAGVSFDGSANIDIPIDNLSDVVITTPSTGQVLEYNGTNWINATLTSGDITGVTAGTNLSGGGTSGDVTLNLSIDSEVAFADQTASAVVLKDYAETDVAVTSSSGVVSIDLANGNTGTITLSENITDIDFTNVPTNGVSTFTLQITQDSTDRTVAINAVTVNGGGNVTAKTAGGAGYTMSTGSGAIDLVTFLFLDAGTPLLNALQNFS